RFARAVGPGAATLRLAFSAPFSPRLEGLYRVTVGGDRFAFTQLEAIDARRMFPCFDEPGFKTPFAVTLTVPAGDQAIANAPESPPLVGSREQYFGVPFPYDKLDVIAVPDFGPHGMENAGAVTIREQSLLLDEHEASGDDRRWFFWLLAHELAHQWFGDLVTM